MLAFESFTGNRIIYWKFDGRKMNRIRSLEEGWSWLFWCASTAAYIQLNKGSE